MPEVSQRKQGEADVLSGRTEEPSRAARRALVSYEAHAYDRRTCLRGVYESEPRFDLPDPIAVEIECLRKRVMELEKILQTEHKIESFQTLFFLQCVLNFLPYMFPLSQIQSNLTFIKISYHQILKSYMDSFARLFKFQSC